MKRFLTAVPPLLAIALAGSALAAADPVAPARSGQQQCYSPNREAKTCRAINAYSFEGRKVIVHARTLLSAPIIMLREAEVDTSSGAICGRIRGEDLDRTTFLIRGQPASAKDTADLRKEVKAQYADLIGKLFCTSYKGRGPELTAGVSIDGVPQKDVSDQMLWIDPKDGWQVAP